MPKPLSVADLVGPWADANPGFTSGLIERCKAAWNKPLAELTNGELATLLRQRIAVEHLLPLAQQRVATGIEDGTETDEDELPRAIGYASRFR